MGQIFVNGAQYAVSSALAAAVPFAAVSNATEAVANTATTPVTGDVVVITSGWSLLNGAAVRVKSAVANTSFVAEAFDTTEVALFPAGLGAGSYQKVSGWTAVNQIVNRDVSGGDQNYDNTQYVDDINSRQISAPTFKSAMKMELEMDFDPSLPWYTKLTDLDRKKGIPVVLRETLPGAGGVLFYAGLLSFNKVPTGTANSALKVKASLTINSDPMRYAS